MTPEKKEISTLNKSFAAFGMALGIFAHARASEPESPAAPVVITVPAPPAPQQSAPEKAKPAAAQPLSQPATLFKFAVTSGFGDRPDPFNSNVTETHKGVDFAAHPGTKVLLPLGDGKVQKTGEMGGYGRYVDIYYGQDNDGNDVRMRIAHLGSVAVRKDQDVPKGKVIGTVGNPDTQDTGRSTGPHIHVELYVGNKVTDLAAFDATKVKGMTGPTAEMFDFVKTGRGRHTEYALASPKETTTILAALDPQMADIIRTVRDLEKPKNSGDPICVDHDGHKKLSCGGLNAVSMGIAPEILKTYGENDFQREYERLYLKYGVKHVPASEKLVFFNDAINFGLNSAKDMLAQAGSDVFKLLRLGSQRYDRIMTRNPDLFEEYRDGWNNRQLALWNASGLSRPFGPLELITSVPAKALLASAGKKKMEPQPKPVVVAEVPIPRIEPAIVASAATPVSETPAKPSTAVATASGSAQIPFSSGPLAALAAAVMMAATFVVAMSGFGRRRPALAKDKISPANTTDMPKVASLAERRAAMAQKPAPATPKVAAASPEKVVPITAPRPVEIVKVAAPRTEPAETRVEPKIITPPEAVVGPAEGPAVKLTRSYRLSTEAPAAIPGRATITMANTEAPLRGTKSDLADGKGFQVKYNDGSHVVTEKDRTTLYNAHPTDDRVLEATLRRVAKEYKGNFKVKIKGDTAAEQQRMAVRIKRISRELGLADRVNLIKADNSGAWIMHAQTAAAQPQDAQRPAADAGRTTVTVTREPRLANG